MPIDDGYWINGGVRFVLSGHSQDAGIDCDRKGDVIIINKVFVPEDRRGQGLAARLMKAIIKHAIEHDLKLTPKCSYAIDYMRRHHGFIDSGG
jgi:uncharacterized protein